MTFLRFIFNLLEKYILNFDQHNEFLVLIRSREGIDFTMV